MYALASSDAGQASFGIYILDPSSPISELRTYLRGVTAKASHAAQIIYGIRERELETTAAKEVDSLIVTELEAQGVGDDVKYVNWSFDYEVPLPPHTTAQRFKGSYNNVYVFPKDSVYTRAVCRDVQMKTQVDIPSYMSNKALFDYEEINKSVLPHLKDEELVIQAQIASRRGVALRHPRLLSIDSAELNRDDVRLFTSPVRQGHFMTHAAKVRTDVIKEATLMLRAALDGVGPQIFAAWIDIVPTVYEHDLRDYWKLGINHTAFAHSMRMYALFTISDAGVSHQTLVRQYIPRIIEKVDDIADAAYLLGATVATGFINIAKASAQKRLIQLDHKHDNVVWINKRLYIIDYDPQFAAYVDDVPEETITSDCLTFMQLIFIMGYMRVWDWVNELSTYGARDVTLKVFNVDNAREYSLAILMQHVLTKIGTEVRRLGDLLKTGSSTRLLGGDATLCDHIVQFRNRSMPKDTKSLYGLDNFGPTVPPVVRGVGGILARSYLQALANDYMAMMYFYTFGPSTPFQHGVPGGLYTTLTWVDLVTELNNTVAHADIKTTAEIRTIEHRAKMRRQSGSGSGSGGGSMSEGGPSVESVMHQLSDDESKQLFVALFST